MPLARRAFLNLAGSAVFLPALLRKAAAQAYPNRPIRFVVPFPAGGTTDLLSRLMGQRLTEKLGQSVVIENRPGGGTNIATQQVVNAAPDGYTLLLTVTTHVINPSLFKSLPFDFARDIAQVSGLADLPLVLAVNRDLPVKTVAEFVAYAKANPGKISIGSFGAKTVSHLWIELLKAHSGIDMVHVPYTGGAPLMADLIPGRVQAGVDGLTSAQPHLRSGSIKALAVMSSKRAPIWVEVPTMGEALLGYDLSSWCGVGAPRGTPPEIINLLNREINAFLADPRTQAKFAEVTVIPAVFTPAQASERVLRDKERWSKVVQSAGIMPE
jgi:tripartite-type tricarboxylate transporter receptor subunit TctC